MSSTRTSRLVQSMETQNTQVNSGSVSEHSIITTSPSHTVSQCMRLRPRTGQILYTQNRSADLLGSDGFQLPPLLLLSHGSNASQMSHTDWLDRLTAGWSTG